MTDFEDIGREYGERVGSTLIGVMLTGDATLVGLHWLELIGKNLPAAATQIREAGASEEQERAFIMAATETIARKIDAIQPVGSGVH